MDTKKLSVTLGKLFLHGILFRILTVLFTTIISVSLLFWLVAGIMFGGLAGFVTVLVVIVVLIGAAEGYANTLITRILWFPTKKGFVVALAQGILLFFTLLVVEVPVLVITIFALAGLSGTALYVVFWVLLNGADALLTGYIGRGIARRWKTRGRSKAWIPLSGKAETPSERPAIPVQNLKPDNPAGLHCPRCGSTRLAVAGDQSGFCLDCREGIHNTQWTCRPM